MNLKALLGILGVAALMFTVAQISIENKQILSETLRLPLGGDVSVFLVIGGIWTAPRFRGALSSYEIASGQIGSRKARAALSHRILRLLSSEIGCLSRRSIPQGQVPSGCG